MKPDGVQITGCKVDGCESRLRGGLGYCSRHYQRIKKRGTLEQPAATAPTDERFWVKVDKSAGADRCWFWQAKIEWNGYGRFWFEGREVLAHRMAYVLTHGQIPDGLLIDHRCRQRACVNPRHLRVATARDNIVCGIGVGAVNAAKTHCKYGHEFTPENIYVPPKRPNSRYCRKCLRRREQEFVVRREAESSAQ